jgi:hypothetical protein
VGHNQIKKLKSGPIKNTGLPIGSQAMFVTNSYSSLILEF